MPYSWGVSRFGLGDCLTSFRVQTWAGDNGRRPGGLVSFRNCLTLSAAIEKYFDAGVLVIVPDLPEKPTTGMLSRWTNQEVQYYKIRIIDSEWEKLDANPPDGLRWRNLVENWR